jgi:hypothetical protein
MSNAEWTHAQQRILGALRQRDWHTLRHECCSTIAIEEFALAYPSYFVPEFHLDKRERCYLVTPVLIQVSEPLSREARDAFHSFCGVVIDGVRDFPSSVYCGPDVVANAVLGHAIYGQVASNIKWFVAMENRSGHWKVRRLVLQTH